jgi:putative transposase
MDFIENNIYHVYNQGNNLQRIFFNYDNKKLFLDKIRKHILPYADILAWCLMSNHFHIMIYVNKIQPIESADARQTLYDELTESVALRQTLNDELIESAAARQTLSKAGNLYTHCSKDHTLNYSIGMMLSSYTQIVNKQQKRSGSLFRPNTKSECITTCNGITPSFFNTNDGTFLNIHLSEKEYPKVCFDYIHNNPVKAGLVKKPEDWEFSSFRDVYGLRNGNLINRERIEEYGLI